MARSVSTIIGGLVALVAAGIVTADPVRATPTGPGTIQIDNSLTCGLLNPLGPGCFIYVPGAGNFTIHNNTSEWAVTGFDVTYDPIPAIPFPALSISVPADIILATTTRDQWSAVATNIGVDGTAPCLVAVDGICYFYGAPIYAAYAPQFSYAGSGNYILPGESDGSFFWELNSPPDPTYVIHLTNIDTNVQGVCTGSILATTGASTSSTCSPPGSPTAVPEPSSGLLFATALLGLMGLRRKHAPCLAYSPVQG